MKKKLDISYHLVNSKIKNKIINIFPETKNSFEQRYGIDEYYFHRTDVIITDLSQLDKLSDDFEFTMVWDLIIIKNEFC